MNVREYLMQSINEKMIMINEQINFLEIQLEEVLCDEQRETKIEEICERIGELENLNDDLVQSSSTLISIILDELNFKTSNMMDIDVENLSCSWKYKCRLGTAF